MSTEPLYHQRDIERYLNNQMTSSEMHAFEKAMLSDPFLSDAFEGYKESNNQLAKQHLEHIAKQINQKENKTKVVGFTSSKWLRIAAVFILLVGAAYITNLVMNKPADKSEMAVTENEQPSEADSISATNEPLAQLKVPAEKAANDNTLTTPPTITEETATTGNAASREMKQSTNDSARTMIDSTVQLQSANAERATMASARSTKDLSNSDINKASAPHPTEGWVKLQSYIDKEVNAAREKNTALTGMKAELEFSVDNLGAIQDIKVISASNTAVAKIASDILRKSPRWTPLANSAKAKIVVNF